jgi:hypothetical protein
MMMLTSILPQFKDGLNEMLANIPFVKTMIGALLGSDLADEINARMLQSVVWVHPVVLAIVWGHEIVFCTRVPAGEIDGGTVDLLLGWPVSRRGVYQCDSLVWLASGAFILALGWVGFTIGAQKMPAEMRPEGMHIVWVLMNLSCVYAAVGGLAYLCSSMCSRRAWAIAIVFGLLLCSFLLSFLAQVWDLAKQLSFLSVLEYYQPAEIVRSGQFPAGDILVLLACALLTWLLGGEIVARRSISTV